MTIFKQPTGQTCTLGSNASGTITGNTTVSATCANTSGNYTLSAAVSGLASGATLKLEDNVGNQLSFTANGCLLYTSLPRRK